MARRSPHGGDCADRQPWALQIACDWQGAAAGWEAINCPYERALALAECQNESAVRTALQIFERLGAAPMAGITRRKLRKRGVRNIPRAATSVPSKILTS